MTRGELVILGGAALALAGALATWFLTAPLAG